MSIARYDAYDARHLRRGDVANGEEDLVLGKGTYGFGISWDPGEALGKVDVDLQCVVVDRAGTIVDCASHNNTKAAKVISHSADESAGKAVGIQELVWVELPKLPPEIAILILVVATHSGGDLRDVRKRKFRVLEESGKSEIARYTLQRTATCSELVGAVFKKDGVWRVRVIEEPANLGQHFMDILPLMGDTIRTFIPAALKPPKVCFTMHVGTVFDLPMELRLVTIGFGWDTDQGEVEMDAAAVLFDAHSKPFVSVNAGHLHSHVQGVRHSGKNLAAEGDGDEEQIHIDLQRITPNVENVVFVINISTTTKTFRSVANTYCRVLDPDARGRGEMCKLQLMQTPGSYKGLIIGKLMRASTGRWGFHALGIPCHGRTWKEAVPSMVQALSVETRSLQVGNGTEPDGLTPSPIEPLKGVREEGHEACCAIS